MLCYPNYSRCPINVISSIKKYYGVNSSHPTLPKLDGLLSSGPYKNITLIVISGMGSALAEQNTGEAGFLRENLLENITSVFPSGGASMISYYTGLSPLEHGWLGQTLFFKEFGRFVDIRSNLDAYSDIPVTKMRIADFIMPYETFFSDISRSRIENIQPFSIAPSGAAVSEKGNIHKTADSFERVCELIAKICASGQNTFTFVYWDALRETAARTGCRSEKTAEELKTISRLLSKSCGAVSDALVLVTAEHGMIDIGAEADVSKLAQMKECLIMPPFTESRATSFFVKSERRTDFEKLFRSELGNSFMLTSRRDVFSKGLLGQGRAHAKTSDFIGDYMACAISDVSLKYPALNTKPKPAKKAASGGLTEQEMIIPLIAVRTERTDKYQNEKLL